jgi:hypothetical protein
VFTTPLLRKFLLAKWSLLVSSLLMIILQLCSLIRVLQFLCEFYFCIWT